MFTPLLIAAPFAVIGTVIWGRARDPSIHKLGFAILAIAVFGGVIFELLELLPRMLG